MTDKNGEYISNSSDDDSEREFVGMESTGIRLDAMADFFNSAARVANEDEALLKRRIDQRPWLKEDPGVNFTLGEITGRKELLEELGAFLIGHTGVEGVLQRLFPCDAE